YGLVLAREHRVRELGRMLSRMAMVHAGRHGARTIFGHASRFNRVAAASHRAAGFTTVEDLIGLTLLDRFTVLLYRRRRAGHAGPGPGRVAASAAGGLDGAAGAAGGLGQAGEPHVRAAVRGAAGALQAPGEPRADRRVGARAGPEPLEDRPVRGGIR